MHDIWYTVITARNLGISTFMLPSVTVATYTAVESARN